MNTLQFGYPERRGLQQGARRLRDEQLGAREDHRADEYIPPQEGLQVYLDYQAYMPDPVMLRETPAAKLFLETCSAYCLHRLH
jgi:hypothetical protein